MTDKPWVGRRAETQHEAAFRLLEMLIEIEGPPISRAPAEKSEGERRRWLFETYQACLQATRVDK